MPPSNQYPFSSAENLDAVALNQLMAPTMPTVLGQGSTNVVSLAFDAANNMAYMVVSEYVYRLRALGGCLVTYSGDADNDYWKNLSSTYANFGDACVLGAHLYVYAQKDADSSWQLLRIATADGTVTEMTISGTTPDSARSEVATDGTDLYVVQRGGATCRRYSVSGTTATYEDNRTMPDNVFGLTCDGTYFYFTTDGAGNTKNVNAYVCEIDGTLDERWKMKEMSQRSVPFQCLETIGGAVVGPVQVAFTGDSQGYNMIWPLCWQKA